MVRASLHRRKFVKLLDEPRPRPYRDLAFLVRREGSDSRWVLCYALLSSVKISQKLDYASRALVHLARKHDGESVVRTDSIAQSEAIPSSFLAQILHELKRSGLATSRRGKTGGWRLTKSPSQITLLEVVEALEPDSLGAQTEPSGESGATVSQTFLAASNASRQVLAKATLEKLAANAEPMYFI